MEIQDLVRRCSEWRIDCVASVSLNLGDGNFWKPLNGQTKLNERDYICVADRSCREIEDSEKLLISGRKLPRTAKIERIFSQHDQEPWTVSLLSDQRRRLQKWLESIEFSKSSTILIYRAVMIVLTFCIKLLLPRVQESLAAKLECCGRHEREWLFLKKFLIVNIFDEILINYRMIQEIVHHHWRFWDKKELRIVWVKNHCNQYLYLGLQQDVKREESLDAISLMSMTNHVLGIWTCTQSMTIPRYLFLGDASAKIPWPNGIS